MSDILLVHLGDNGAVIPIQLHQATDADPDGVFDLTGYTAAFKIVSLSGRTIVEETSDGIDITDAEDGRVEIQLEADMGLQACKYPLYVKVYRNDRVLTAPVLKQDFIIDVQAD